MGQLLKSSKRIKKQTSPLFQAIFITKEKKQRVTTEKSLLTLAQ